MKTLSDDLLAMLATVAALASAIDPSEEVGRRTIATLKRVSAEADALGVSKSISGGVAALAAAWEGPATPENNQTEITDDTRR